jgi:hypothetical protein
MERISWLVSRVAALAVLAALGAALPASAKETFGPFINTYCTNNGLLPAQPYGSQFPQQCQLCHKAGTFDKKAANRVQPNWDAFVAAHPGLGGNGDYSFFCPDAAANRPPVLAAIGNRSVDPGLQLAFVLSASDLDGDALSFDATGLPAGAELIDQRDGTAGFAWTPTIDQAGNHEVTFTVTDAGAPAESDSEVVILSVGDVNQPPVLALVGDHTVYEGGPFAISLDASDPELGLLAFSVEGVPPDGVLLDGGDGTGELGWTPATGSAGSYPLTVTVADDGLPPLTDVEDLTVTVIPRPANALYLKGKVKFKAKKGMLKLKGAGAAPLTTVEILAVGDGGLLPLGTATSTKKGKFRFKATLTEGPCSVVARVGDLVSLPVVVTGAPVSCTAP